MASISHSPLSLRSPGPNSSAQTPNNSHGQHTASADEGSPSIRKRFTKSLRRKLHQHSTTREENKSPQGLKRRKSIVNIFGSISGISKTQKQTEQDVDKDDSPHDSEDVVTSRKDSAVEGSSSPVLQRRKSLSGMFGTISQKVSPKRTSLFRRRSQNHHGDFGAASQDAEKDSLDPAKAQAVVSTLDNPPPLPPRLNPNSENTHISFAEQVSEVYDDIKEQILGTRQSSVGSDTTLFNQAPTDRPTLVVPSRIQLSCVPNEDRPSTPDSYLQALIESQCSEIASSTPAEGSRETPDSYLQLLIESQGLMPCTPNPTDESRHNCQSVSPSKCQPVEPVDFIDGSSNELKTMTESLQANHRIPEIKISPVSESENSFPMVLRQEYEDRRVAREKVKLVVATMTENFHADHNKHGDSVDNTAKQEFESDQSSVWDVIKIGEDLLKQPDPQSMLKSFPSNENLLSDLPVPKTRGNQQIKQYKDMEGMIKQYEEAKRMSMDNVVPIQLKAFVSEIASTETAIQGPTTKHESIQDSFTETSPLGVIRVEYPSCIRQFANVQTYDSKEEAVAAILGYKHSELSEYGIYDRENRFLHARLPEAGKPDLDSMKQHGLEAFQLPSRSQTSGNRQATDRPRLGIKPATSAIWENEDPPSPSKRSEDALVRYLSNQTASNATGVPTLASLGLSIQQSQTDEVESIMNDDFFLEDQSQLAVSSEGSQSVDQSRVSSLTGILLHKDKISRPPSDSETLFWGDEEYNTPTAPTWAQLGQAHLEKSPIRDSSNTLDTNTQEYNNDAVQSESSGRSSPYQKFFFDPTFLQCPDSRVPEKIDWQSGGFCDGCKKKIHIGEKNSNVTSSRHYLTYETFYPNLHSTNSAEGEHSESGFGEDNSEALFESVPLSEIAGSSLDPAELVDERPMLPRIASTNGREYTLSIPAGESFSWSSFLNGNVDGLFPFFGEKGESMSDDFDASDTSICSRLGDSINTLEYKTALNEELRPFNNDSPAEEQVNFEDELCADESHSPPMLLDNSPFRQTASTSRSEAKRGTSSFVSEFDIAECGILHKFDPTFALIYSDLLNSDADEDTSLETPRASIGNALVEGYPNASPEPKDALEKCWDMHETDLGLLRDAYAKSWKAVLGTQTEPSADSAATRDVSYGSHGAISLRDGFRFSQHEDLLLAEADEAILEAGDSSQCEDLPPVDVDEIVIEADGSLIEVVNHDDIATHDSVMRALMSPHITVDVSAKSLPSRSASQEFAELVACAAILNEDTKEEHVFLKAADLILLQKESGSQLSVVSEIQALQVAQTKERVVDTKHPQPPKRPLIVKITELFQPSQNQEAVPVPPTVPKKPKVSHLISMLEARGSRNTGLRNASGVSPPRKTRVFTPAPVVSSGVSDLNTDASVFESAEGTPEREGAGVGPSIPISFLRTNSELGWERME